ncbi:MAG TPA: fibrobacter succinogenes major paralogous domain-containing protein [Chitinophagaceae bacterium]|nr:fibrobacter succinogenes major paralogous domain-containing protein [Chitinophagaceae bacterium]
MQQKHFFFLSLIAAATLVGFYSCKKNCAAPTPPTNTFLYDGFTYHTITIPGAGTWTVENARNTHFNNGDPIRNAQTDAEWKDSTNKKIAAKTSDTGAWCYYNNTNSTDTQSRYGKLYNWYAVKDARGLAPEGWRVATDADFINLKTALGDSAGHKLKSIDYWTTDDGSQKPKRNSSGFTVVPAGLRNGNGNFYNIGSNGYFWSSTELNSGNAWYQSLNYNGAGAYRYGITKLLGCSVRFVRD